MRDLQLEPFFTSRTLRLRANAGISVKGVVTWDCTVEGSGYTREELLAEHDALVAELKARYPVAPEAK